MITFFSFVKEPTEETLKVCGDLFLPHLTPASWELPQLCTLTPKWEQLASISSDPLQFTLSTI